MGYNKGMRQRHHIDQLLYALAELAFAALLVGAVSSWSQGAGLLALCGCVASASLLAVVAILHIRLVQGLRRAAKAQDDLELNATAPTHPNESSLAVVQGQPSPAPVIGEQPRDGQAQQAEHEPEAPLDVPDIPQDETAHGLAQTPDATPAPVEEPRPERPTLDFGALSTRLVESADPLAELKRFVGDIRTREADAKDDPMAMPSELERYAARMLDEAGLFAQDVELPAFMVVRPRASRMVYLRTAERRIPYLAKLRIIKLEAALNAIRFACASLPADATMEDAYRLNQGLARSIIAQASPIDEPLMLEDVIQPDGEWAVRYGISQAIETLQLPYRLSARFRTNVADGNVAIEVEHTPAEAFPTSCLVDGLGIVPTTGDMRQRASADYALRLALLLAASAFRCTERIRHVWVAGIHENGTRRTCYYAVDFDRYRFSRLDLSDIGDLQETYRSFAPQLRYEDGWLRPVKQTFDLEQERFCPKRRYLPVSLTSRRLTGQAAQSLGTDHVSGLAIEEADNRALVANAIMLRLAPGEAKDATVKNVRTVMELAGDDPDPTVRSAAERVVSHLVDGTLSEDPIAIGEEFVRGDALTRATDRAKELLMRQEAPQAQHALEPVLSAIDEVGTYADTSTIAYRFFASYVDRTLYNRLYTPKDEGRSLILVPDAYYEAHLLLSVTCLMQGDPEGALVHAERLVQLSPLDSRARLHLVRCLEELDRDDEAVDQLKALLNEAHDPQGLGFAYYRMAFFQWKRGNIAAAHACYQSAIQCLPQMAPTAAMELSILYLQNPNMVPDDVTDEQIEATLDAYHIPVAPTQETSELFYECAQASLDAEIFPVARNFAAILGVFSGDDIISGLVRSLEDYPDR